MDCERARPLLQLHLDDALTPGMTAPLEAHLALCAPCRRALEDLLTVRGAIREHADRFTAPAALRSRILAGLPAPAAVAPRPPRPAVRPWGWVGLGAALAASLMLAVNLTLVPVPADRLADRVVSAHIRSLMEGHLTDVASSDRHTVKPWFNGRLDLAPPVRDFAGEGFPLVGGRLDVLEQRPVAALVYRRRQHVINLFVGPDATLAGLTETGPVRGYTLFHWSEGGAEGGSAGGLGFWLVSDLERSELAAFAALLRSPPTPQ